MSTVEERWIQWWCAPWQGAHRGWLEAWVQASGWPATGATQLLRGRHGAFLSSVGIAPSQPPTLVEGVAQWLLLSVEQQGLALRLAASICLGHALLDEEGAVHEDWCRGVAKALRPGAWLDPALRDSRELLATWAGEACWPRLRLSWAPEASLSSFADLPVNKLQTLWQAVLWRAGRV